MHRDLPRISKPIGGLQYLLPLLIILGLSVTFAGWLMFK
jgi:hypothetical protein